MEGCIINIPSTKCTPKFDHVHLLQQFIGPLREKDQNFLDGLDVTHDQTDEYEEWSLCMRTAAALNL